MFEELIIYFRNDCANVSSWRGLWKLKRKFRNGPNMRDLGSSLSSFSSKARSRRNLLTFFFYAKLHSSILNVERYNSIKHIKQPKICPIPINND